MTQRLEKDKKGQGSRPKFEPRYKWARGPKMKINTIVRTKFGVYSWPSLRIAENQEQGKDKRRIFCPGLLKTHSFSSSFFFFDFFFDFLFSIFLDFPFSNFLDFSFFYFFYLLFFLHIGAYLIELTIHKLPKVGLILFHTQVPT